MSQIHPGNPEVNRAFERQPTYEVTTYDMDTQEWTRQSGMRRRYKGFAGLRKALRKLRAMGYSGRKGDPCVRVERE